MAEFDDNHEEVKYNASIIIDNGSYNIRAGFSNMEAPKYTTQSVIGTPKNHHYSQGHSNTCLAGQVHKVYVGNEACNKTGRVSLQYPIQRGIITNWIHMEQLWTDVFSKLHIDAANRDVMMAEHALPHKEQREQCMQVMFDTFCVGRYYAAISSVLSMLASNVSTGISLESGHGVTFAVPVYEGVVLSYGVEKLQLGGLQVTDYLIQQLKADTAYATLYGSHSDPGSSERQTINAMKEKLCFVAKSYQDEVQTAKESMELVQCYQLPDQHCINVNRERFESTEIMFNPKLIGLEHRGIHHSVSDAVNKCDDSIHEDLWQNVVLSGGNTMFDGLQTRLQNELRGLMNKAGGDYNVKVIAKPNRDHSVWIGASLLASLSTFDEMWVQRDEYEECGASIVHRKCSA